MAEGFLASGAEWMGVSVSEAVDFVLGGFLEVQGSRSRSEGGGRCQKSAPFGSGNLPSARRFRRALLFHSATQQHPARQDEPQLRLRV